MTYDGLFIKSQLNEISNIVCGEHISKIVQQNHKEICLQIRKFGKNHSLILSAEPSFPYILLSNDNVENMNIPPAFCMLLRKYIQSGIISNIKQINNQIIPLILSNSINNEIYNSILERVVDIEIYNIDEFGDNNKYHLIIEIMGKYSNIILTDSKLNILDVLIKSITVNSRLKQKTKYNLDNISTKKEILFENETDFKNIIESKITLSKINNEKESVINAISKSYAGITNSFLNEIKIQDDIDKIDDFSYVLSYIKTCIKSKLNSSTNNNIDLYNYLISRNINTSDSTEKKNVEQIIKNIFSKLIKKIDVYNKDLSKCEKLEIYKTYGDLIATFGYDKNNITNNILKCKDYNNNDKIIEIPLDLTISISDNVNRYYERYNKLKRTKENATKLLIEANDKIEHLNSIKTSLELSNDKNDIYLIKEELAKYFDESNKISSLKLQKDKIKARKSTKSKVQKLNYNIHHYKSSDGIDIYVGKNNLQNEYLTFTLANPNDTWLHVKNATGSHVIIKKPYNELSDKSLIEAASLAAYYSDKKNETKATVDYTLRKELKKVKGKAPGFCIYHKNFSINVKPEVLLKEC